MTLSYLQFLIKLRAIPIDKFIYTGSLIESPLTFRTRNLINIKERFAKIVRS